MFLIINPRCRGYQEPLARVRALLLPSLSFRPYLKGHRQLVYLSNRLSIFFFNSFGVVAKTPRLGTKYSLLTTYSQLKL